MCTATSPYSHASLGDQARIGPLLDLALLHHDFNQPSQSCIYFREALTIADDTGNANPFLFLQFPLREDFWESIVQVMDADEVEQWIGRLSDNSASYPLAGGLVAALASNGMHDRADGVYQRLKAPECRLYAAWGVLRGFAVAGQADR